MSDPSPSDALLDLVNDAFKRLLAGPDADHHVAGFAQGDAAFVLTRDGLEVRRTIDIYGSPN